MLGEVKVDDHVDCLDVYTSCEQIWTQPHHSELRTPLEKKNKTKHSYTTNLDLEHFSYYSEHNLGTIYLF